MCIPQQTAANTMCFGGEVAVAKCGDDRRGCFITINWRWRHDDSLETTCSVCVSAAQSAQCLPPPSAITRPHHLTPQLSPFRQFSHERLNNADSSVQQHGQRMILYFLAESNMNHTAPQSPHRGRIGKLAVWRRTRISYFLYFLLRLRYCPHMELVKLQGSSRGWGQ